MTLEQVVVVERRGGLPVKRLLLVSFVALFFVFGSVVDVETAEPRQLDLSLVGDIVETGGSSCSSWSTLCYLWTGETGQYQTAAARFAVQIAANSEVTYGWQCETGWAVRSRLSNLGNSSDSAWHQVNYVNTELVIAENMGRCAFSVYESHATLPGSFRTQNAVMQFETSENDPGDPVEESPVFDPNDPPDGWCYMAGGEGGGPAGHPGTWYQAEECFEGGVGYQQCIASHTGSTGQIFLNVSDEGTPCLYYHNDNITWESVGSGIPGGEWCRSSNESGFNNAPSWNHDSSSGSPGGGTITLIKTNGAGQPGTKLGLQKWAPAGTCSLTVTLNSPGADNPLFGGSSGDLPPDADGDGYSDHVEGRLGSDPNDPDSTPDSINPPPPTGDGGSNAGDMNEFCAANPNAGACDETNDMFEFCAAAPDANACQEENEFWEFCSDHPTFGVCEEGNAYENFCTSRPAAQACQEGNDMEEWCTGAGADTASCNPYGDQWGNLGGGQTSHTPGSADPGTIVNGSGVIECDDEVETKVGYVQAHTEDDLWDFEIIGQDGQVFNEEGLATGFLQFFEGGVEFIGNRIGSVVKEGANGLTWIWNNGVDAIVPGDCLHVIVETHYQTLVTEPMFAAMFGLQSTLETGIASTGASIGIPAFEIAGESIDVTAPLEEAGEALIPYRPVLAGFVMFLVALTCFRIILSTFGVGRGGEGGDK